MPMTPEEYEAEFKAKIGKEPVVGRIIPCELPTDKMVPCNNCHDRAVSAFAVTQRQLHMTSCQTEFQVALCWGCIVGLRGILEE